MTTTMQARNVPQITGLDDDCEFLPREADETVEVDAEDGVDFELMFPEYAQATQDGSHMPFGSF